VRWKGRPLGELRVDGGEWTHTVRMSEALTAKAWGLTPSQFRGLSDEDAAEMMAVERVTSKMRAWEMTRPPPRPPQRGEDSASTEMTTHPPEGGDRVVGGSWGDEENSHMDGQTKIIHMDGQDIQDRENRYADYADSPPAPQRGEKVR
jgi:hypothetical protein